MQNFGTAMDFGWFILSGVWATLQLTVFSCLLALILALLAGISLTTRNLFARVVARVYVEIFRGTSVFVQLFAAFFVLPFVGISLTPIQSGVLALGLNGGAYGAEVVRAAINAVGRDQREATIALNLTRWQALWWVVLPQAVVLMLPSFGNLAIEIMKGTAVASLITVSELTFQAQTVRAQTGDTAVPFLLIMVIYLLIASLLTIFVRRLEKHFGRGIVNVSV